jgi:peptide/nickel transport system substrate-binding protein
MPNRTGTVLFLLIGLLLIPSSCRHSQSTAPDTAQSLTIATYQPLSPYNPLASATTLSARLTELVFDGLVRFDDTLAIQPHLAASWELSGDQRTWTFHLRQGVTFHDGVELTGEDVKFTLVQLMKPDMKTAYSYSINEIEDITVQDRHTVQIRLKNPVATFLSDLVVGILPKHLLDGKEFGDSGFAFHPIGTGPFKVVSGSETGSVLQANEHYFLGPPQLDRLVVKVYPSQESAWAGLTRGESDFFWYLSPSGFQRLRQIPGFQAYSALKPYYYLLAFNLQTPLFRDRAVRQALNYAIDKTAIVNKVLKGQGQVAAGTVYPGSWGYDATLQAYPYDPQKALALLETAGWRRHGGDHFLTKDGHRFEFTVYSNAGDDLKKRVLLLVQQQFFDLGIQMNVALFDAAETGFLFQKRFEAHFPEIDAGRDPDINYKYWHSSQIQAGFNVGSYRNAEVDRLLEAGRYTFDQEERRAIYARFQRELHDDPPGIFLFWTDYLVGVNERFKGVRISPAGPFASILEWHVDGQQSQS